MNRREFVTASLAAGAAVAMSVVVGAPAATAAERLVQAARMPFPMGGLFFAGPVPRADAIVGDVWLDTTLDRYFVCIADRAWDEILGPFQQWQAVPGSHPAAAVP